MAAPQQGFSYQPLDTSRDSIRLVRILPSDGGEVHAHITNESLDAQHGRYIGVSYTWGSAMGDKSICLNGHRFPVRENVHDLLQSFRRQRINEPLWIDSICIDQTSLTEKSHQVAIMAKIYSRASCVCAWLGDAADDSDWLFEFLDDIQYPAKADQIFSGQSFRFLLALQRFAERVYWSRIWIVQEIVLAKDIRLMCGTSTLAWRQIEEFFTIFPAQKMEGAWLFSPQLTTIGQVLDARKGRESLMQLFDKFGSKDCSIRHDKIYALLGINHQLANLAKRIPIDYASSVTDVLYRIVTNWEVIEPNNKSTTLDFACRFVENVTVDADEWQNSERANERIDFNLGEPTLSWLDWFGDIREASELRGSSYHFSSHDHGSTDNSRLYASLSGSTSTQRGDTYYRLTTDYPFHSLVVRWPSLDSLSTQDHRCLAIRDASGPLLKSWKLSFMADRARDETKELLSRLGSDATLFTAPGEGPSLQVNFYTFVCLAKYLSQRSKEYS